MQQRTNISKEILIFVFVLCLIYIHGIMVHVCACVQFCSFFFSSHTISFNHWSRWYCPAFLLFHQLYFLFGLLLVSSRSLPFTPLLPSLSLSHSISLHFCQSKEKEKSSSESFCISFTKNIPYIIIYICVYIYFIVRKVSARSAARATLQLSKTNRGKRA